jgi:trigger factor
MNTELIDVSATRKQLVCEIPAEVVEAELSRVVRDYARQARIPGFRPGKAPTAIVRQRFREQIHHDVVHDLVPRLLETALRERDLEPVATPGLRDVHLEDGQPLRFTAEFETVPPFAPVDVTAITVRRPPIAIAEDAVDGVIGRLRERHARFDPVEGRTSAPGDVLTVDLTRRVTRPGAAAEGGGGTAAEPERHPDVRVEIGAAVNPPGFDAEVTGLAAGDDKTFLVSFPADYPVADVAGAEVEYAVRVKDVKQKVLPALDDEFAKDLGEFDSLGALRERVRADLQADAERTQARDARNDVLRQLAARVEVEVPEALVDQEIDRRLEEFAGQLMQQGVDLEKAGIDWTEFRERQRDAARESVKGVLALDDFARREAVAVDRAELDAEVARLAQRSGRSVEAVRQRLASDGGLERLESLMRRDRALERVLSRATILNV